MFDEEAPLDPAEARAAATAARLGPLVRGLVLAERWLSGDIALRVAADPTTPLEEAAAAARAVEDAIADLPSSERRTAGETLGLARRELGRALERRVGRPPRGELERVALAAGARLLAAVGDTLRAAALFEGADHLARAAELYGTVGEIERMEACLERIEAARSRRHEIADGVRRFERLVSTGARREAMALARALPHDHPDVATLRREALELERRLCTGRTLGLKFPDGRVVRVAGAPATIGRDPAAEIPLRDPGISRAHARLEWRDEALHLLDAGSRAGTFLGPAAVAGPLPLHGSGELRLGIHGRFAFEALAPGLVGLRGLAGLDRDLRAFVCAGRLGLSALVGPASASSCTDAHIDLSAEAIRLSWSEPLQVRLDGRLVPSGCELLRGERVDVGHAVRLEIL
jgi:hypothetical protein